MPRIIDRTVPEQEAEWRSIRGVGSSDASAIMGMDKWSTIFSTWELKTRRRGYTPANAAMQRGIEMEPKSRAELEFELGAPFPPVNMIHDDYPWMRAAFDGWNEERQEGCEIKTAGKEDHGLAKQGLVPPHYVARLDHLLMVSGSKRVAYCSYNPDEGNIIIWYERNETRIKELLQAELEFWQYVQKDEPPPLTLRDFNVREDDAWQTAAREYKHWQNIAEQAQAAQDLAEAKLVALSREQSTCGSGVKVLFFKKKGQISYKKMSEDLSAIMNEPLDTDKYRGEEQLIKKVSLM